MRRIPEMPHCIAEFEFRVGWTLGAKFGIAPRHGTSVAGFASTLLDETGQASDDTRSLGG